MCKEQLLEGQKERPELELSVPPGLRFSRLTLRRVKLALVGHVLKTSLKNSVGRKVRVVTEQHARVEKRGR